MKKYNFLFYQVGGDLFSIAERVKAEGYPVFVFKTKEQSKATGDSGKGIFTKEELVPNMYKVLNEIPVDQLIIIVDDNSYGEELDFLRNLGYTIIGGSAYADKIEYERGYGTKVLKQIGLNVPPTTEFSDFNIAIKFIEKKPEDARFVMKPEGDEFAGSSKTYTGKNRQDLIDYIRWIINDSKEKHYEIRRFELQTFIPGTEADFSAYFDGEHFIPESICVTIEEKKIADGNKGESTGCMGQALFFTTNRKYFDKYIVKLEPQLQKANYVGQVAFNNIFAEKDGQPYALEFTPRMGWDSHLGEMAIHQAKGYSIAAFYISLVTGKKFHYSTDVVSVGVRVTTGSPTLKKTDVAGRFFSFDKSVKDNLWFYSVAKKEGSYEICDNPVLFACSVQKTLPKAIDDVYENILKKLNIPDIYFREQIGERATEVIKFLEKHDWL